MFGYVTVDEGELKVKDFRKYKAYYCGLCRELYNRHGVVGQLSLTYDMTFAVILLTSLYECPTQLSQTRCISHPFKKQKMLINEMTSYAADMNLILSYYHMKDGWEDEKKAGSLLGSWALKNKVRKLLEQYPRQGYVIKKELQKLLELEKEGCPYIDMTAGCFGRLMAEMLVYKDDIWAEWLRGMGFYLGKFIYIMDACEDMENDIEMESFNPLKVYLGRQDYEKYCRDMLCMMIGESCARFECLPCVSDADILRNILYSGVWNRYREYIEEKNRNEDSEDDDEESV